MDHEILVEEDVAAGETLVRALDAKNFDVLGALWYYDSDAERYKLILETPRVKSEGRTQTYVQIKDILDKMRSPIALDRISVVAADSPLMRGLERAIVTTRPLSRIRLQNSIVNGIRIEDAMIYRLTRAKVAAKPRKILRRSKK